MSASRILVALGILSAISGLVHRYVWARLIRDAGWPGLWPNALTATVFTLAALIPLVFVSMRILPRSMSAPLAWVVYSWMGFALYLFLFTVVIDMARGAAAIAGLLPVDPDRRQVLARTLAATVAGLSALVGIGGLATVARGFVVRRVPVPLAKLPKSASGYAIVQMTDVHI